MTTTQIQNPLQQLKSLQERLQKQNYTARGSTRGGGSSQIVITDQEANPNNCLVFDTLINSIFSPKSKQDCNTPLPLNVCTAKELPCFYEFLNTCTPRREDDLVYGTKCLRHLNVTNRTYTAIGTQTSVDMQPIFTKTATCEPNLFLWSFLTNVSYAKAKDLISYMNISTTESNQLAKFIMAVSEPQKRDNSLEFQLILQYLSAYCQHAIRCLDTIPDRNKILVPINFTQSFLEENFLNSMMYNIIDLSKDSVLSSQNINDNGTIQIFVPLSSLNLLDQINLLSFRIHCGVGRVSLAPNVSVTGDRVYIGTGLSIHNAISTVKISKMRSVQPDALYRLIVAVHGDEVHNNYDTLVLLTVPDSVNSTLHPPIFLAKRIFVGQPFDIEKYDTLMC